MTTFFVGCVLFFMLVSGIFVSQAEEPKLLKAVPLSQTAIQLRFDGQLAAESAENVANYEITPDIVIEEALLDERKTRVMLFTTPLEVRKTYQLILSELQSSVEVILPMVNEITFGESGSVTFPNTLQDTSLIVEDNRKTRNNNAGAEQTLGCTPAGRVFFVAFDLFDAFADMGITEPTQVLKATLSLHVQECETDAKQTVILRRVLLPWREGRGLSERAEENELTYNSALHRNLPWNKPPAQAMLEGINGDKESDYNGSEDVAHRIDGLTEIQGAGKRYTWDGELLTGAVQFWVANPDYNYGYLFALRDGNGAITFASKESSTESLRPLLTIRYRTQVVE